MRRLIFCLLIVPFSLAAAVFAFPAALVEGAFYWNERRAHPFLFAIEEWLDFFVNPIVDGWYRHR